MKKSHAAASSFHQAFVLLAVLILTCFFVSCNLMPAGASRSILDFNICGSGFTNSWHFLNTSTGAITTLSCAIHPKGEVWGCYTSAGLGPGAIAELAYDKTDPQTYWNPGLAQDLKFFLYDDPNYGWRPIIAYTTDLQHNYISTSYYYSIPPGSGGEPLFQDTANSQVGWLSVQKYDNSCQQYPGQTPSSPPWVPGLVDGGYQYTNGDWRWTTGMWSTTVNFADSISCDGIVDYCGPAISLSQHEGAYSNYSVGTLEKWWFSNDPTNQRPWTLTKVQQTQFDGSPIDITLENVGSQVSTLAPGRRSPRSPEGLGDLPVNYSHSRMPKTMP